MSSDDGFNAAGGNDSSGYGGGMPQDNFSADSDAKITISGGKITFDAKGDGLDSNGSLCVSGGEIFVTGPSDNGNGALDYNGDAQITGGTIVAVGMSGMTQNFGSSSTQVQSFQTRQPIQAVRSFSKTAMAMCLFHSLRHGNIIR